MSWAATAFGEVGGVEFEAEHQADAANIDDAIVTRCEFGEFCVEEVADVANVVEQVVPLDGVDDGDGNGAGQWAAAEGGAVHAGGDGASGVVGAEHRAHGNAVGDGLGEGGDVGEDAVVLVGEPFAGSAEAALDLVGEQEGAGGVAEFACGGEELSRDGVDAALALDGLDADGADFVGEFCAEVGYVVEADEFDAGHDGFEGLAILLLVRGGDRAHGAAVEAVFEGEEFCADVAAFGAETAGVGAREFERGLPCFGAAVAEEDAVEAADLGEAEGELGGVLVEEEVRGVDEALALAMIASSTAGWA